VAAEVEASEAEVAAEDSVAVVGDSVEAEALEAGVEASVSAAAVAGGPRSTGCEEASLRVMEILRLTPAPFL
jgi:hypothetical protein